MATKIDLAALPLLQNTSEIHIEHAGKTGEAREDQCMRYQVSFILRGKRKVS